MAAKVKKNYVVVNRDGRIIRKAPDKFAEPIIAVKKGEKYLYLNEVKNCWYKVRVNRKEGWIHSTSGSIREM